MCWGRSWAIFLHTRGTGLHLTHQDRRKVNTLIPSRRDANPEGLVLCCVSNVDLLGCVCVEVQTYPSKSRQSYWTDVIGFFPHLSGTISFLFSNRYISRQIDSKSTYTATFSAVCSDVLLSATGESSFMTISTIFKVVISSHIVSVTLQTWKHHGAFTDNVVPLARGSLFVYSSLIPTENDHRRSCLWNIHPTFIGFRGRLF